MLGPRMKRDIASYHGRGLDVTKDHALESPSTYLELTNESDTAIPARVHFTSRPATSEAVVVPTAETRKVICQ